MPDFDPDVWRRASPYLDQALDLSEADRAAWLAGIRSQDSALADELAALLLAHDSVRREGFLENGPRMPSAQPARAGELAGAYRLLEPIGDGGMGTVWLAERSDGRFVRRVAIKFPQISLSAHGIQRFIREGSILGA